MPDWFYTHPEVLLFATAALLYLQDLSMLLFANEVLLLRSGSGEWTARIVSRYPEFARRHLAMVRPWRPDTVIVRACWPGSLAGDERRCRDFSQGVSALQQQLRFIRLQTLPLLLMMFFGLPCLYAFVGPTAFLLGLAVVYGQVCLMLACLLLERRKLNLRFKVVFFMILESLICIPHSINIYRKIVDHLLPQDEEPMRLASAVLDAEAVGHLRRQLLETLEARIDRSEANDLKKERLVRYKEKVLEWKAT